MRTPVPVLVAWVTFAVAWLAPSMDGRASDRDFAGWMCFLAAIQSERVIPILSALTNGLMFVSVLHFTQRPAEKPRAWLIGGFVVATILN